MTLYYDAMRELEAQTEELGGDGEFTELAIFKHLMFHTWTGSGDGFGWVFPAYSNQGKIARTTGCSVQTVGRALRNLEAAGMVTRVGHKIYLSWLDHLKTANLEDSNLPN